MTVEYGHGRLGSSPTNGSVVRQQLRSPPGGDLRHEPGQLADQLAQLDAQKRKVDEQAEEMRTLRRVNESLQVRLARRSAAPLDVLSFYI